GPVPPETTLEDIRSVVQSALDHAIAIDGRRDIVAKCHLPDSKMMAELDRRLMVSVLREIIGNAIRLASSQVLVEVEVDAENGLAVIRVHDDGPGFSHEVLQTVGERFTPRPLVRGLGLSLSIAKDVLDAHGGQMRFDTSCLPPGRRG